MLCHAKVFYHFIRSGLSGCIFVTGDKNINKNGTMFKVLILLFLVFNLFL